MHIDDLSVHLPAAAPLGEVLATLTAAADQGKSVTIQAVDQAGTTVDLLVTPGNARLVAVSQAAVVVPRKTVPD